ncbi:hypothetical protein GGX14DRAFT_574591 [Mycena pura]|uniref:Uncharacterized protein n=1 Tax=Mycena pura TaxID=153505 RepID=A0AAD6Y321_9AGAR|nr:hypothetical protein GGX14DRAFT_574591 [Mycena pura]
MISGHTAVWGCTGVLYDKKQQSTLTCALIPCPNRLPGVKGDPSPIFERRAALARFKTHRAAISFVLAAAVASLLLFAPGSQLRSLKIGLSQHTALRGHGCDAPHAIVWRNFDVHEGSQVVMGHKDADGRVFNLTSGIAATDL